MLHSAARGMALLRGEVCGFSSQLLSFLPDSNDTICTQAVQFKEPRINFIFFPPIMGNLSSLFVLYSSVLELCAVLEADATLHCK